MIVIRAVTMQNEHNIILDSITDGVFTVDTDWRITSFNRAAEEITGIPREEALGQLEASFKAWRSGEIGPFELSDRIHKFHNGPSRELWSRYESLNAEMSVPLAFVRGVLKEEDVPPELLEQLRRSAELRRSTGY